MKSDFPRAFQEHHECLKIPIQFSVSILFNFHWENGSISNSFHTIAPKSLKPSQCTPTHQSLLKTPREWHEVLWFRRSQLDKTKQNKLPCFIDRCTKVLSIKSKSVWYARHYNTKLWEKKKKHGSLLTSTHIPYLIIYLCLPHPTYNSSLFSHHHLWTWKCVQYKVFNSHHPHQSFWLANQKLLFQCSLALVEGTVCWLYLEAQIEFYTTWLWTLSSKIWCTGHFTAAGGNVLIALAFKAKVQSHENEWKSCITWLDNLNANEFDKINSFWPTPKFSAVTCKLGYYLQAESLYQI
jgi:hypothetical protein